MSNSKNEGSVESSDGRKNRRITDRRNKEDECDICGKRFTRPNDLVPGCRVCKVRGEDNSNDH